MVATVFVSTVDLAVFPRLEASLELRNATIFGSGGMHHSRASVSLLIVGVSIFFVFTCCLIRLVTFGRVLSLPLLNSTHSRCVEESHRPKSF